MCRTRKTPRQRGRVTPQCLLVQIVIFSLVLSPVIFVGRVGGTDQGRRLDSTCVRGCSCGRRCRPTSCEIFLLDRKRARFQETAAPGAGVRCAELGVSHVVPPHLHGGAPSRDRDHRPLTIGRMPGRTHGTTVVPRAPSDLRCATSPATTACSARMGRPSILAPRPRRSSAGSRCDLSVPCGSWQLLRPESGDLPGTGERTTGIS